MDGRGVGSTDDSCVGGGEVSTFCWVCSPPDTENGIILGRGSATVADVFVDESLEEHVVVVAGDKELLETVETS
jgi:hypothetical protein